MRRCELNTGISCTKAICVDGGVFEVTHNTFLARFLRQEALVRDAMESGIDRALDLPDANQPNWSDAVAYQIETACTRMVDNFLSYVSEILQLAMVKQPAMLRSAETITVDEVMRFSRHSDLVSFLTDRTISRLSYKSFAEIEKYVADKTKISITNSDEEASLLITSIELRNIYTHNRGEASAGTIKRLEAFDHPLELEHGKLVETSIELLEELLNNIGTIARRVDREFIRKFRLRHVS